MCHLSAPTKNILKQMPAISGNLWQSPAFAEEFSRDCRHFYYRLCMWLPETADIFHKLLTLTQTPSICQRLLAFVLSNSPVSAGEWLHQRLSAFAEVRLSLPELRTTRDCRHLPETTDTYQRLSHLSICLIICASICRRMD